MTQEHLEILKRFQVVTQCSYEYLVEKALEWFPEYRDQPETVKQCLAN